MKGNRKRAHKTLNILNKLKILDELSKGRSIKSIAMKYGIGSSTVCDIKKKSAMLKSLVEKTGYASLKKRKTLRSGEHPEMELKLYDWFMKQRRRNVPISQQILCEKAKQIFSAWSKVKPSVIKKCWNKILQRKWDSEDDLPLSIWIEEQQIDKDVQSNIVQSIQEVFNQTRNFHLESEDVIEWLNEQNEGLVSFPSTSSLTSLNENECIPVIIKEKHKDAVKNFNACIKWAEENNISLVKVAVLRELKEKAFDLSIQRVEQTTIKKYFKPKN